MGIVGGNSTGGQGSSPMTIMLAPNTNYLIKITNDSGAAKDVSISLTWIERQP